MSRSKVEGKARVCDQEGADEERPSPDQQGMWSTVQAAITGGWSTTIRLIAIIMVIAVVLALLGTRVGTPISALLKLFA